MTVFDEMALAYDNTIDWNSRLKSEMPFIISSVTGIDHPIALDMACGSGRHAIELVKNGFEVYAFDSSKVMVETAKRIANDEGIPVDFQILKMQEILQVYSGTYDLITCLGNSLALLDSMNEFEEILQQIHSLLTDDGVFVFQTLNFEAVEEQGIRFMPSKTGVLSSGEEVTFSRFLDYTQGDPEKASLVLSALIDREGAKPVVQTQDVLKITGPLVEQSCEKASFSRLEIYSDYHSTPFQREYDRSIVVRARK